MLSPLAWPLSYRYPVHLIKPDYQPDSPPEKPSHILVYRNRRDEIKFMKLNDVSRLLFELMQEESGSTGLEMLTKIAAAIEHPQPASVISAGGELLNELRNKDVLLGSRR